MDVSKSGLADLLERHTPPHSSLNSELALLMAHSAEKQTAVEERLQAIDEYLSKENPSVADVDQAAAKLGVSRRQFYRLLTKVRAVGPVKGLLPGFQNVARASVARDGLAEPIEALLVKELEKDPAAKIAYLEGLISTRCDQLKLDPPTEWQLRQRVHALRAAGVVGEHAQFGSAIIVDQIGLEMPVRLFETARYVAVTLILDQHTRLIAGAGLTSGDGMGMGLRSALHDMNSRIKEVQKGQFPVAPRLGRLSWVVPPGLEDVAHAANGVVDQKGRKIEYEVIEKGPRRHGESILRLVGDKLGPYSFRTRTDLGMDAERADNTLVGAGDSFEHAQTVVRYCVESWNEKLLQRMRPRRLEEGEAARSAKRLRRIGNEIETFLMPVLEAVESRYPPAEW